MTENLKSELEYLKNNVPDVNLEENPKFADEINTDVFSRVYYQPQRYMRTIAEQLAFGYAKSCEGKVQELVIEQENEIAEEKPHIDFTEANAYIFDVIKTEKWDNMFPDTDFTNENYIDILATLADNENANAQNILGVCYYTGNNCELNKELGIEYLERAIEQNHTAAMRNLAIALENVDAQRSLDLYKRAAKLGDKTAKVNLEYMQARCEKKQLDRILSLKERIQDELKETADKEKGRDER
ncbi:MAG: sel1 repeat family protein [Firmicutes bacterium]|nr:sel1 repeat family protein [Bacillota bacterium]